MVLVAYTHHDAIGVFIRNECAHRAYYHAETCAFVVCLIQTGNIRVWSEVNATSKYPLAQYPIPIN